MLTYCGRERKKRDVVSFEYGFVSFEYGFVTVTSTVSTNHSTGKRYGSSEYVTSVPILPLNETPGTSSRVRKRRLDLGKPRPAVPATPR